MGRFSDWFFGTENGPQSSSSAPEARSVDPYISGNGTVHDGSAALDIPTRGDWLYKVSSNEALSLVAVYRSAQVISTSVMQLSFDAERDGAQIEPKPLILRRPDADESLPSFLEMTTLSLVLNGNFFWRIFRDNQGRVTGLRVLNPRDVHIKVDKDGNVLGYDYQDRTWSKQEIKHGSLLRVPGDPRGRGPIQAAQAELRGAIDTRDYSANWFQDAGVPTGILSSKGALSGIQLEEAKERWIASQGGQRGPAVLSGDWSYTPVYLSPEDAQWLQVRQFDTTAIARLFGIPASLMIAATEGSSMTYTNVAQAWTEFSRFTLTRYVIEIESALSDVLPRGTEVKANVEALLRPDTTTRYQMHQLAVTTGWMTKDEVRDIEGLQPLPNGLGKAQEPVVATAPEETPNEEAPNE